MFCQNIDCGYTLEPPRRGGSNEYQQSMFWNKNKKNRNTPANPNFHFVKVGYKGVYISCIKIVSLYLHGSRRTCLSWFVRGFICLYKDSYSLAPHVDVCLIPEA